MTDPFAVLHPPAILEATKALEAVMCNCWPRIYQGYAEEAARIIATCWLNLQTGEVDGQTLKKLQKELKISGSMLQSIQQARGEKQVPRLAEMLEAEPKLGALFSEPLTGA